MHKHEKVFELVKEAYESSKEPFAKWAWENHVPIVAEKTKKLSKQFGADEDLTIAGAWLHDFGDAFVHRHSSNHEEISRIEAIKILTKSDYSEEEIKKVLEEVILPHSCKDGLFPTTLGGKVMATADALAHLTTDFYLQFAWMHLPEGKKYHEYLDWACQKIERDFHSKIFFNEVREKYRYRYEALKEFFAENDV